MKVEIKNITSPDILNFEYYNPEDKKSFSFLLELEIGELGKDGADLFTIEVCTPKWLIENYQTKDIIFGQNKIIVFEYDIKNIIDVIEKYLDSLYGDTWKDIVNQISKIAKWEFEGYES